MKFYYIDLIDSVCRVIQDPTYVSKLYHAFEMQVDSHGNRMFQNANSGLVFESIQLLDPSVSPILVIVASDASHHGHSSRHPLYCEYFFLVGHNVLVNYNMT